MSGKALNNSAMLRSSEGIDQCSPVSVLAVGEPDDWRHQGKTLPNGAMAFVAFHDVTASMLEYLAPSVIISPVLAPSFDCIELATLLHHLDYTGAYRAVSSSLPKPELIEREVSQICGRLDFRIVMSH